MVELVVQFLGVCDFAVQENVGEEEAQLSRRVALSCILQSALILVINGREAEFLCSTAVVWLAG